jgi:hypothetical protein
MPVEQVVQGFSAMDLAIAAKDLDLDLAALKQLDLPAFTRDGYLQTHSVVANLLETTGDVGILQTPQQANEVGNCSCPITC